jgi:hypothetical protein
LTEGGKLKSKSLNGRLSVALHEESGSADLSPIERERHLLPIRGYHKLPIG